MKRIIIRSIMAIALSQLLIIDAFADEAVLDLAIKEVKEDKKNKEISASITNFSDEAKKIGLAEITIHGIASQAGKKMTKIDWQRVSFKEKSANLDATYKSNVIVKNNIETKDHLKAKGSYESLVSALERIVGSNNINGFKNGRKMSLMAADGQGSVIGNTSRLSTFAGARQAAATVTSAATGDPITTTDGCSPRVDYQLNKVFIQQRVVLGTQEVQSCKDSSTSYALEKDYGVCPKIVDTNNKKIFSYFQYFYVDDKQSKNIIDSCQVDNSKTTNLEIIKSYSCPDYVDYNSRMVYAQFKQSYKDIDGKEVLLTDCTADYSKNYQLIEDAKECSVRNLFDLGYSIRQTRFYYVKDGTQIVTQQCQDTDQKYSHYSTAETCKPIIDSSKITVFSRKYIVVDSIRQYISDCSAIQDANIQSDNCVTTPFTHDFVTGQSYRNKNYYYLDNNGNRVEVSSCIKSEETFQHYDDTSSCNVQNDDASLQTNVFARKYITVDGSKNYITNCAALATPVPYKEVGYKWTLDYNISAAILSASGVSDKVYLGSKQGVEKSIVTTSSYPVDSKNIGESRLFDQYNIASYSTSGKCSAGDSYSYNGNLIDLAISSQGSITCDNYVEQISQAPLCYNLCTYVSFSAGAYINRCESMVRQCESSNNILYYQRCTNYRCSLYKYIKKSIYQRYDKSELVGNITTETKYSCGDAGLNNQSFYYP